MPHSQLHFRVLDHSTFRKDTPIGDKKIGLGQILSHYNGKIENLELTLDLMDVKDQSAKVGELVMLLDGLRIDTTSSVNNESCPRPQCIIPGNTVMPLGKAS